MVIKKANSSRMSISPLNNPRGWEIFNLPPIIKTASLTKDDNGKDLGGFDIKAEVEKHPEHLFVKIFAIKEEEVNDNADFFPAEELEKSAHTFIGVPIFTNHQNNDIEKARGECVHAWYDKKAGGIFIIARVDKVAYPPLARGIEEGYIASTSMGTSVEYSICSVCHNKAHTAEDYCSHVKNRRNRKISGNYDCEFHKSACKPTEKCPVCKTDKGESKKLAHKDMKVYEINHGLKFIENSFVVNPACHDCGVRSILHIPEVTKKISKIREETRRLSEAIDEKMSKAASSETESCTLDDVKVAGKMELDLLNQALNYLEKVAKSMMSLRSHVDPEFVSDLTKTMSDLSNTVDELNEMGYAQVPTPPDILSAVGAGVPVQAAVNPQQPGLPPPGSLGVGGKKTDTESEVSGEAGEQADVLNGLGTITRPKTSYVNQKKDFVVASTNLRGSLIALAESSKNLALRREKMASSITDVWQNKNDISSRHVMIDDEFVTEAQGDKVLKVSSISELPADWQEMAKSNPTKLAEHILSLNNKLKETESAMSTNTPNKVAAIGPKDNDADRSVQHEIVTEKQLSEKAPKLSPRWDSTYEQTTESKEQLGRSDDKMSDTSLESPQKRLGSPDITTEGQLEAVTDIHLLRFNNAPEVITEKQWDDMSRLVSANIPDDWREVTTEQQLRMLLQNHATAGTSETITQDQLKRQDWGAKRWASQRYAGSLLKTATAACSECIATYSRSPQDISNVINKIVSNEQFRNKASWVAVVNSLPNKKEARKALANNVNYFRKMATKSQEAPNAVDAVLLSVASVLGAGLKVEDVFEAMGKVISEPKAMTKVQSIVKTKLAQKDEAVVSTDKFAAFNEAVNALEGIRINATVEDIGVDYRKKAEFVTAVKKFANDFIAEQGFDTGVVGIDLPEMEGDNNGSEFGSGPSGPTDGDEGVTVVRISVNPETGTLSIDTGEGDETNDIEFDSAMDDVAGDVADPMNENGDDAPVGEELEGEEFEDDTEFEDDLDDDGLEEDSDMIGGDMAPMTGGPMMPMTATPAPVLASRTASRKQMSKQAQMMGGQMGGQGGASQAPGAGAGIPGEPPAEAPPVESLEEGDDMAADADAEDSAGQAKPPGATCPVCSSDDVDLVDGKGKCNACGSEYTVEINLKVTRWSGLLGEEESSEEEEPGLEGEGFEMPDTPTEAAPVEPAAAGAAPAMPVAASSKKKMTKEAARAIVANSPLAIVAKLKPEALKFAKANNINIGRVSPITGTQNTVKLSGNKGCEGEYACLDTGTKYNLELRASKAGDAYARWSWLPPVKEADCTTCKKARTAIVNALKEAKISEDQFSKMNIKEKIATLVSLKIAGHVNMTKVASASGSIVAEYQKKYAFYGQKFPTESCREKLARRYGKNSLALSGPCEGQPIHECVCNELKNAGIYSHNIATKIAEAWSDRDGTEECVEHNILKGMNIREAAVGCAMFKLVKASNEDLLAEDMGNNPMDNGPEDNGPGGPGGPGGSPSNDNSLNDEDPFNDGNQDGEEAGTVTLELSPEVAKELDAALDVQLGSDPSDDLNPGDDMGEANVVGDGNSMDNGNGNGMDNGNDIGGNPSPTPNPIGDLEPTKSMKPARPGNIGSSKDCGSTTMGGGNNCGDNKNKGNLADNNEVFKETNEDNVMAESNDNQLKEARNMRSSFNQTGRISMDLSSVMASLKKSANEKEIQQELVQDSKDIGQYSAGNPLDGGHASAIGHEKESVPTAGKVSVPRSDARMGHESDNIDKSEPLPKIPSDKGTMGHESETGLSGGDVRFTGGVSSGNAGAGKSDVSSSDAEASANNDGLYKEMKAMNGSVSNSRERTSSLAERIRAAGKLDSKKPVADDEDVKPYSNGKTMGNEEKFDAKEPTNTEGSGDASMMGHEKETIGGRPTAPKDQPEIPSGDALIGHEEGESVGPEKQNKIKGTVIAKNNGESDAQKSSEAFRVAGRMLQEGIITSGELQTKVAELTRYEPTQIRDYEKAIFAKVASARKGLDTVSDGLQQSVVMSESSSLSNNDNSLQSKIQKMFRLNQQNKTASESENADLHRIFR